jgi:IS30 family transposase
MEENTSESINRYSHLTLREREEIALGLEIGLKQRQIAANLNRSPSTISREIKRGSTSHNRSVCASPPYGGSGYAKMQSGLRPLNLSQSSRQL